MGMLGAMQKLYHTGEEEGDNRKMTSLAQKFSQADFTISDFQFLSSYTEQNLF